MPLREQIDSSEIEFRFEIETAQATLPGSPIWKALNPTSIDDFGPALNVVRRETLSIGRREQKGVVVGLDATGGFSHHLELGDVIAEMIRGYFFAAYRDKDDTVTTDVDGTGNAYQPAAGGDAFVANDLIFAKGFGDTVNNGLKVVTGAPAASNVPVTDTGLIDASTQTGTISRVGFEFGAGEVETNVAGTLPVLARVGGAKDFLDFGLVPGEWVHIGGDGAATQFATATENGWKRIKSITSTTLEFDKSENTMVADDGATKTIRLFFGRVVRDETGTLIVRTTYQFEESLGVPDTDNPTEVQSIYGVAALPSELTLEVPTEEIVTGTFTYIMTDYETRSAATNRKAGTRPTPLSVDAVNSTNDVSRIRLSLVDATNENVVPLFAHIQEVSFSFNNNLTPNKAVRVLGNIGVSSGRFSVGAEFTAYFRDTQSVETVRNNSDMTLDAIIVKGNRGMAIDMPLVTPSNGQPQPAVDEPITVPIELIASTGAKYDPNIDHTCIISFFDYLPDLADLNQQS
jgi:hypothetical protein